MAAVLVLATFLTAILSVLPSKKQDENLRKLLLQPTILLQNLVLTNMVIIWNLAGGRKPMLAMR